MDAQNEEKVIAMLDDLATIVNDLLQGYSPKELHKDPYILVLDAKECVDTFYFNGLK